MMSRAIAIQQLYLDLATIAQIMIGNNPSLLGHQPVSKYYSSVAVEQYGVPYDNVDKCVLQLKQKIVRYGGTDPGTPGATFIQWHRNFKER